MKTISSRHNPIFKRVRDAMRDPEDEIVIEGRKQIEDALTAGWQPLLLLSRGELRDDATAVSPELFDSLSDTKTPQDLIGVFQRPRHELTAIFSAHSGAVVVLDAVQDPGNVGTIVRLAAAFDCAGVVLLPGCADAYGPKAVRASVGAVLRVAVATGRATDVTASGLQIFAADGEGAPLDPPARNAVLVFGNEGSGVSDAIRRAATLIRIPMSDRVESLNVAASAAILLSRSYALRSVSS
jgi:RNA methyltransferase, TrmH family